MAMTPMKQPKATMMYWLILTMVLPAHTAMAWDLAATSHAELQPLCILKQEVALNHFEVHAYRTPVQAV